MKESTYAYTNICEDTNQIIQSFSHSGLIHFINGRFVCECFILLHKCVEWGIVLQMMLTFSVLNGCFKIVKVNIIPIHICQFFVSVKTEFSHVFII